MLCCVLAKFNKRIWWWWWWWRKFNVRMPCV